MPLKRLILSTVFAASAGYSAETAMAEMQTTPTSLLTLKEAATTPYSEYSHHMQSLEAYFKTHEDPKSPIIFFDHDQIDLLRAMMKQQSDDPKSVTDAHVIQSYIEEKYGIGIVLSLAEYIQKEYEDDFNRTQYKEVSHSYYEGFNLVFLWDQDDQVTRRKIHAIPSYDLKANRKMNYFKTDISLQEYMQRVGGHEGCHVLDKKFRAKRTELYEDALADEGTPIEYLHKMHQSEFFADLCSALIQVQQGDKETYKEWATLRAMRQYLKGHAMIKGEVDPVKEEDDKDRLNLAFWTDRWSGVTYELSNVERAMNHVLKAYGEDYIKNAQLPELLRIATIYTNVYAYTESEIVDMIDLFENQVLEENGELVHLPISRVAEELVEKSKKLVKAKRRNTSSFEQIDKKFNKEKYQSYVCDFLGASQVEERLIKVFALLNRERRDYHDLDAGNSKIKLQKSKIEFLKKGIHVESPSNVNWPTYQCSL